MKKFITILLITAIPVILCACSSERTINENTVSTAQGQESIMTDTSMTEKMNNKITVKVGGNSFSARLYDNETAKAFSDMLPLTLEMNELHGNEKYYNLNTSLPTDSLDIGTIKSGDIMLYGDNCIVLFYDSFPTEYSYTKIGYIEDSTDLADLVGSGNVTVTFEK